MKDTLPIDAHLDAIMALEAPNFVLRATPGSGKTTRVPPALARKSKGRVLCVEPRRLAAIAAAKRCSAEAGQGVGDEIGYHVRMDKKLHRDTKLVFLTTGMLLQYLCADPMLEGIDAVIFDEFHERSLDMDTALAMCRFIQREASPELRIIVMSATIDPEALTHYLAPCDVYDVEAPRFPLEIEYAQVTPGMRFFEYSACLVEALERAAKRDEGDILVFLPGMADINNAEGVARTAFGDKFDYFVCHASLPIESQTAILRPESDRRRIVFATNVAESSITIPRVTCVIDTGLAKEKFFDSTSGLSRLETTRISRASADQRAGRAARIAPGLCIRLWNLASHNQLDPDTHPQIERLDLAQPMLQIYAWGLESPHTLEFLTPPRPGRVKDACELLLRLGALARLNELEPGDDDDTTSSDALSLTQLGTQMASLPLEPRLARWMMAALEFGCEKDASLLAAYLSEAPYRRGARELFAGPDLECDLEILRKRLPNELTYLKREANDILEAVRLLPRPQEIRKTSSGAEARARSMLAAYPDRLAEPRQQTKDRLKQFTASDPNRRLQTIIARMTPNRGVALSQGLSLTDAKYFICADLDLVRHVERASNAVLKALAVEPAWIDWKTGIKARYEPEKDRVVIAQAVYYDVFTLRETFLHDPKYAPLEQKILLNAALKAPLKAINVEAQAIVALMARMRFVKRIEPGFDFPELDEEFARLILPDLVKRAHNFEELRALDLTAIMLDALDDMTRAMLDACAPKQVKLENGRLCDVDYTNDPPIVRVRIQQAFDTWHVPRVGGGKVPVLMHLCAPNNRTAQVTQDMDSFWKTGYPELRKLLKARYPKHDWRDV